MWKKRLEEVTDHFPYLQGRKWEPGEVRGLLIAEWQGLLKLLAGPVCVNNTFSVIHGWKCHEKLHGPKTWLILLELETIQPSFTLDDIPSPPRIWQKKIIFSISFSPNPRSP